MTLLLTITSVLFVFAAGWFLRAIICQHLHHHPSK